MRLAREKAELERLKQEAEEAERKRTLEARRDITRNANKEARKREIAKARQAAIIYENRMKVLWSKEKEEVDRLAALEREADVKLRKHYEEKKLRHLYKYNGRMVASIALARWQARDLALAIQNAKIAAAEKIIRYYHSSL